MFNLDIFTGSESNYLKVLELLIENFDTRRYKKEMRIIFV